MGKFHHLRRELKKCSKIHHNVLYTTSSFAEERSAISKNFEQAAATGVQNLKHYPHNFQGL